MLYPFLIRHYDSAVVMLDGTFVIECFTAFRMISLLFILLIRISLMMVRLTLERFFASSSVQKVIELNTYT